jgi:hypothetical protein
LGKLLGGSFSPRSGKSGSRRREMVFYRWWEISRMSGLEGLELRHKHPFSVFIELNAFLFDWC